MLLNNLSVDYVTQRRRSLFEKKKKMMMMMMIDSLIRILPWQRAFLLFLFADAFAHWYRHLDSSHILTSYKLIREDHMNVQDKKVEGTAPEELRPRQQKGVGNSSRIEVEEQQEGAGGPEELQHAPKRERGKYKQYEDSQVIIEKIRSYRTQRYPDSEIMKLLDNMPRRTYYNYVKKLQEQDRQIMDQWKAENVEHVSEEMMIYRETLCQKLREVQAIIDNENTSAKDKMQAIDQYLAISKKLVDFDNIRSNYMREAGSMF
jgi:hypothetical protein